jgi:acyl-CoA oxidase
MAELHATSAGLKAFCTDMALSGLEEVRKCCGGQGYAMSGGLGQLILDYIPNVTFEGDKIPMALQTARFLVREWTNVQEGKTGQIVPAVAYFTQTLPKLTNLRCPVQLTHLMEEVVRRSLKRASASLQAFQKGGKTYDEAWSASQVLLVRCAYNHCMLTALRSFNAAVTRQECPRIKTVLGRLASLFGLHIIQTGSPHDWAGVVTEEQVAEMHSHMSQLLSEIRPDAVSLVDAWDFDDANLYNSCIGREDGDVYRALVDFVARAPTNDPDYQDGIFRDFLKKHLDLEYIKKGAGPKAKL